MLLDPAPNGAVALSGMVGRSLDVEAFVTAHEDCPHRCHRTTPGDRNRGTVIGCPFHFQSPCGVGASLPVPGVGLSVFLFLSLSLCLCLFCSLFSSLLSLYRNDTDRASIGYRKGIGISLALP
jgi:hypothetical protein